MLLSSYIIVFKITYYSFQFLHQSIFYYKNTLWQKVLFRDCRQQPSMYIGRCLYYTPPLLPSSFVIRLSSFLPFSITTIPPLKGVRGMLSPSAYGLRPIAYSSFFRLETLFLPFLALLYYIINQFFTHPFYTNRPRFV